MNTRFHSGAEHHSRLFRMSHANARRPGHFFSWVCLPLERDNPLAENGTISPRIVTSYLYSFTDINNARLPSSRGRAPMLSSDQICAVLIGRIYFDQSVTCTCLETFRFFRLGLLGFCRVCPENFPSKGLKILPIGSKVCY